MNICVFCASSSQVSDAFKSEARLIGQFIAENGHTLIYGGATGRGAESPCGRDD